MEFVSEKANNQKRISYQPKDQASFGGWKTPNRY